MANAAGKPLPKKETTFSDKANISAWALEPVGQMQAADIMNDTNVDKFPPIGPYTREQSIVTAQRMYDILR
ncbi:MAG: hypothetical protein LBH91_00510 [Prevotellaceae bacterium]|nr:hypothetical protein [Prevotellaceae bacterium]